MASQPTCRAVNLILQARRSVPVGDPATSPPCHPSTGASSMSLYAAVASHACEITVSDHLSIVLALEPRICALNPEISK